MGTCIKNSVSQEARKLLGSCRGEQTKYSSQDSYTK